VRHVTIYFFLEDDTLQIYENRDRNSGMPQGTFLRRHRAKKDDDFYVTVGDFKVGSEFTIYGRTYFISDCDPFTRNFLDRLHREGAPGSELPPDPYLNTRTLREYEETHRNRGVPKPEMLKLRQFLANDGHVLRFYALWDDRDRAFGDLRRFILNYYLADDTMEVRETLSSNDGRDPFPSFVRRSQVPKEVLALSENDPRFLSADHYYRPTDLKIGGTINVLNRAFFIYDCDEFTRVWYRQNYGYTDEEMARIAPPPKEARKTVTIEIPPPSLIGSDEDTMRNVLSLHPSVYSRRRMLSSKYENPGTFSRPGIPVVSTSESAATSLVNSGSKFVGLSGSFVGGTKFGRYSRLSPIPQSNPSKNACPFKFSNVGRAF
jgi:hypothetical protein